MAGPTKAGTKVVWGTDSDTTYGLIQSMTTGNGGEMKDYRDHQGDTVAMVVYDQNETIQLTAICVGDAPTLPKKGEEFTVGDKTYRCTEASVNWSNEDAASVSISGRTYPNLGGNAS